MVSLCPHLAGGVAGVVDRCPRRGVLTALALGLGGLIAHSAEPSVVLDGWFAAQTHLHTWTAGVVQTRTLTVLTQPLVATGRVWVALPDRFRWELGQPAQTIALRRPEELFVIYPRLKRAEKYPLDGKQAGPWRDALALLDASFPSSRAALEARFQLLSVRPTNTVFLVTLQPLSPLARRMMKQIEVGLHTNDFSLASTELTFSDGSTLRNDFAHAVANGPLPGDIFDANLAPDVTVVEPLRQ